MSVWPSQVVVFWSKFTNPYFWTCLTFFLKSCTIFFSMIPVSTITTNFSNITDGHVRFLLKIGWFGMEWPHNKSRNFDKCCFYKTPNRSNFFSINTIVFVAIFITLHLCFNLFICFPHLLEPVVVLECLIFHSICFYFPSLVFSLAEFTCSVFWFRLSLNWIILGWRKVKYILKSCA